MEAFLMELVLCLLLFFTRRTWAIDTLTQGQSIKDGETLVSAGASFELRFFSPGNSKSRYVGIWYKKVSTGTVVWVANRENLVSDASGVLSINEKGILSIMNGTKGIGYPQVVVKKGADILFRAGSWNGLYLTGSPLPVNPLYSFELVLNENEVYYTYQVQNNSIYTRFLLNPSGLIQRTIWNERTNNWEVYATSQSDQCSIYAYCGSYATCSTNESPPCKCLEGFINRSASPRDINSVDWSYGCSRRTPLACHGGDSFLRKTGLKLPDTSKTWANISIDLKECEKLCLKNCSCTAYANLDIREGGHGCLLWFGDLIDIIEFSEGGQDLYIRLATSDLNHIRSKGKLNEKLKAVIIAISVIIASGTTILALLLYVQKIMLRNTGEHGKEDLELPVFDFATIATATDNFSSNNILGQGGFGPVYKGTLIEGQEIAVKRLSKNSGQGLEEFKNEVTLISKLQHRNLVKLFGCCIRKDEKMLVYEYMPNKNQTRSKLLDWRIRMHIVDGIARGVLYLHHDSRLKIIHRDLKASNILLDHNMNPKISDFGLARKFGVDQTQAKTKRVVGTYGYMSPEYALDGLFSMKSDVFSFGVL
ncbi:hypothetical protein Goshw_002676, partial [Gossypium schwendimanii]|nr:hypothetical protein [Gossypium schwendimanii]